MNNSVFPWIRTEYGDLRSKSPYFVRIQENKDQKKLRIWTFFTQCTVVQQARCIFCKLVLIQRIKMLFRVKCKTYLNSNVLCIDPEEKVSLRKMSVERFQRKTSNNCQPGSDNRAWYKLLLARVLAMNR